MISWNVCKREWFVVFFLLLFGSFKTDDDINVPKAQKYKKLVSKSKAKKYVTPPSVLLVPDNITSRGLPFTFDETHILPPISLRDKNHISTETRCPCLHDSS